MEKKKKTTIEEGVLEYPISLSLKCPSCDWEWSDSIYYVPASISTQCPRCFHKPIYLISLC